MQNKLKVKVTVLITFFVILVGVGILSYSYTSFTTVDSPTTVTQEQSDEGFLEYYMRAVYNRLFSGQ